MEGLAQIGPILTPEACIKPASAGYTHAVATLTEVMRQWCDKPEPAAGLLYPHIPRRPTSAVVDIGEMESTGKVCTNGLQGQEVFSTI